MIIVIIFVVIILCGFFVMNMMNKRQDAIIERIKIYTSEEEAVKEEKLLPQKENLFDRIDEKIVKQNLSQKIQNELQKADMPLRISEYILFVFLFTSVGMLVGFLLSKFVGMLILGVLGYKAFPIYVKMAQKKRQKQFADQLENAITLISNCLKSGYSFLQGVEMVAKETPPPISIEFYKIMRETSLGLPTEDALNKVAQRMESDDFELLVTAVIIQRQTGGNLAEILDNIGNTIRERVRLKGEINALTAMGKMSGGVVSALPFGLGVLLYFMNPEYMIPFFTMTLGKIMIAAGLIMMGFGIFVIKRIISIEV